MGNNEEEETSVRHKASAMREIRCDRNLIVFQCASGWAGILVSGRRIARTVLPKREKVTVERELKSELSRKFSRPDRKTIERAVNLFQRYFSGERVFFDLPLDIQCYTSFQQAVWRAAMEIPYGETRSYSWIAKKIKNPLAVRAVGQSMGANPIPIIIP